MIECSRCGKDRDDVEWLPDPYLLEVREEYVYADWCPECYADRAAEV